MIQELMGFIVRKDMDEFFKATAGDSARSYAAEIGAELIPLFRGCKGEPTGTAPPAEPVATLIVRMEYHDVGQGPREPPFKVEHARANANAKALPAGEYPLYLGAQAAQAPDETFWLIERGPNQGSSAHCWWNNSRDSVVMGWKGSVHEATQYATKEEAELVVQSNTYLEPCAVTSHSMLGREPTGTEPARWKMVPLEPTDAMLAAAVRPWQNDPAKKSSTIYRAMVSAAPPVPAQLQREAGEPTGTAPPAEPVAWLYHDAPTLADALRANQMAACSMMVSVERHPLYRNETPLYAGEPTGTAQEGDAFSVADLERAWPHIINIGRVWYSRAGPGFPHVRHNSLVEALRAALRSQGGGTAPAEDWLKDVPADAQATHECEKFRIDTDPRCLFCGALEGEPRRAERLPFAEARAAIQEKQRQLLQGRPS